MEIRGRLGSLVVALALEAAGCGGDDEGRRESDDAGTDADRDGSDAGRDAGERADDAGAEDAGNALQAVTLRFAAKVGASDFACGQRYPGQGSTQVEAEPRDFRFYVQDVRLIDAAGREVPVQLDERAPWQTPELALLDFENGEGRCAGNAEMNTLVTGKVPRGMYRGVAFKNGVPAGLNHANPASVPAPLQAPGVSWNWLAGFRFVIAELTGVPSDAGAGGLGLLHLGSTACEGDPEGGGRVTCARPNRTEIRLGSFDPATDVVVADLGALFAHTDLSKAQLCHSALGGHSMAPDAGHGGTDGGSGHGGDDAGTHHELDGGPHGEGDAGEQHGDGGTGHGHGGGSACTSMFVQLGIDPASGEPLESQSVFRVE